MPSLYLIGSLRNPEVPKLGEKFRTLGYDVFDGWHAAGERADDEWQHYALNRGQSYEQALRDYPAQHVFNYDKRHLQRCDGAVLVMPAGKSGHLEFGYFLGRREAVGLHRNAWIYLPTPPERFDVMYAFATRVCVGERELLNAVARGLPLIGGGE